MCPKGHKIYISWDNFKGGQRCKECFNERQRKPFEEIKKNSEKNGFKLLSTEEEYKKNPKKKLKYMCPKGHIIRVFWNGLKTGIKCRECFKMRMRILKIKEIKNRKGQVCPNYNPLACKRIIEYGEEHGYNFQHAENGGEYHIKELGYWVDGYDKEKNVVIEIDEPAHFDKNGNLSKKDLERQKEIEDFLGCRFIRLRI